MSRDAHDSRLDAQSKKSLREIVAIFFELRTQNIELRTLAISSEGATDNKQVWSTQCGMPVKINSR